MYEPLNCEDCGGKGVDVGSLYEPEACQSCQGSGKELVETSPASSLYMQRKPMGRITLPHPVTAGELAERSGRYGD